jgi:hypothetical protein
MRMLKATAVATGALASLATLSAAPAFAAAVTAPAATSAHAGADYVGKHRTESATDSMDALWAANAPSNWIPPWEAKPAPLISILNGSVINILPWQICGSTVTAGVGGTVPLNSPNTVLGTCNNANTTLVN